MRVIAGLLAIGLTLAVATTGAYAHARLKQTSPAAGAELAASPHEVRLRFSEPLSKISRLEVVTKAGKTMAAGGVDAQSERAKELAVPISVVLPRGEYEVRWRAVAADSHLVKGAYTFRVR